MNKGIKIALCVFIACFFLKINAQTNSYPNIVLIVADDLGYNDVGFNGGKEIPTPNIDRIANNGVKFTQGYVSAPVCGPSRAGLMTGRMQDRFGFCRNPLMAPNDVNMGLPLTEETLADLVKKKSYNTKAIGKWHLGAQRDLRPLKRGFDEFYGFLGGGHKYFPEELVLEDLSEVRSQYEAYNTKLLSNNKRVEEKEYLTNGLTREGVKYIRKKKSSPFFLYMAYNAPHKPLEATPKYLMRFKHIKDQKRRTYAAMVSALDDGVGEILDELERNNLTKNTLVVFLSDNGGPETKNASDNGVLREGKGTLFEGGIRVPFAMQWPKKIKKKQVYNKPVISLDIFATVAAQINVKPTNEIDGVNLIPYVTKKKNSSPHSSLFWKIFDKNEYAVVSGNHKILKLENEEYSYNLEKDISESTLDTVFDTSSLKANLESWNLEMNPPSFLGLQQDKKYTKKHPERFFISEVKDLQPEWENLNIYQLNTLEPKTSFYHFSIRNKKQDWIDRSYYKSLNGYWNFKYLEQPNKVVEGFNRNNNLIDDWENIYVPSNLQMKGYDFPLLNKEGYTFYNQPPFVQENFNPIGVYKNSFEVGKNWEDKQIYLHFNSVSSAFYLWINGKKVGYSEGTKLQTEFDVTDYLVNGTNDVLVQVFRWSDGSYLEGYDSYNFSGIDGDVYLYAVSNKHISNVEVDATLDNKMYQNGFLKAEVAVDANFVEKGDYIELEIKDKDSKSLKVFKADINKNGKVLFNEFLGYVESWSSENPNLYNIECKYKNSYDTAKDEVELKIGFRSIETKSGELLINGKPLLIKGVYRSDFNSKTGNVLTKTQLERDIINLKRFNINAVRLSGPPSSPFFYELCDKHGVYIVSEIGVETHLNKQFLESNSIQFEAMCLNRLERVVKSYINHPSIIYWSFGDNFEFPDIAKKMYTWTKQYDPSRPVHYSLANKTNKDSFSDIISQLDFNDKSQFRYYVNGKQEDFNPKPIIISDFTNYVGEDLKNLEESWSTINKFPELQGGFLHKWFDSKIYPQKALQQNVMLERDYKLFNSLNSQKAGLIDSNEKTSPSIYELKKVFQNLSFEYSKGNLNIKNLNFYKDTSNYKLKWSLIEDGVTVDSKEIKTFFIVPRGKTTLPIYSKYKKKPGFNYLLNVNVSIKTDLEGLKEDHVVASEQFVLNSNDYQGGLLFKKSLKVEDLPNGIVINGKGFSYKFSKEEIGINSMKLKDQELINSPLSFCFLESCDFKNSCESLNDVEKVYKKAVRRDSLMSFSYKIDKKSVKLSYESFSEEHKISNKVSYVVNGLGEIILESKLFSGDDKDEVYQHQYRKHGVVLQFSSQFVNSHFYGKGPYDNFVDRSLSSNLGLYNSKLSDFNKIDGEFYNVGSRTDVQYLTLIHNKGVGLTVSGVPEFNFILNKNVKIIDEKRKRKATCYSLVLDNEKSFYDLEPVLSNENIPVSEFKIKLKPLLKVKN